MKDKKSNSLFCDQSGFTLLEVFIALALSGMVMASIYSAFKSQQDTYKAQDQIVEMQQNGRAGLNLMVRELRMAGLDPSGAADAGITAADSTGITFTMVADDDGDDNDNDGIVDEDDELMTIQYDVYDAYGDGDNDIGRQVGAAAATKRAICENIEAIEYFYTLDNGTSKLNPAASEREEIRTIHISILLRTGAPVKQLLNSQVYQPASNSTNGTTWGPFNDGFRRRLLMTTIQCRNMGL